MPISSSVPIRFFFSFLKINHNKTKVLLVSSSSVVTRCRAFELILNLGGFILTDVLWMCQEPWNYFWQLFLFYRSHWICEQAMPFVCIINHLHSYFPQVNSEMASHVCINSSLDYCNFATFSFFGSSVVNFLI